MKPDIQCAVNYIARYVLIPHYEMLKQADRILMYLLATKD